MVEVLLLLLIVDCDQLINFQIVRDLIVDGLVEMIRENGLDIADVPEGAKAFDIRTTSRTESCSSLSWKGWRDGSRQS